MSKAPINIREATVDDAPFIFNSWLKSFRPSFFGHGIPNDIFYREHHKIIQKLLKQQKVLVACDMKDPSVIYGYVVYGTIEGISTVHYVYTKHTFRQMRIATALLEAVKHDRSLAGICTHMTKHGKSLAEKHNLVYHPYVALTDSYIKE